MLGRYDRDPIAGPCRRPAEHPFTKTMRFSISILSFALFTSPVLAETTARQAGRAVGEFGAGVGEAVGQGVARSLAPLQPEWITVAPRSKEECIAESHGVLDATYMRCGNGRQEFIRFDPQGRKQVLGEHAIPNR